MSTTLQVFVMVRLRHRESGCASLVGRFRGSEQVEHLQVTATVMFSILTWLAMSRPLGPTGDRGFSESTS